MRADIHDGREHNTLQSEAGYIDARPHIRARSTKPSCNARPDHTSGSFASWPALAGRRPTSAMPRTSTTRIQGQVTTAAIVSDYDQRIHRRGIRQARPRLNSRHDADKRVGHPWRLLAGSFFTSVLSPSAAPQIAGFVGRSRPDPNSLQKDMAAVAVACNLLTVPRVKVAFSHPFG
jgi:hypothetical protein